MSMTRRAAVAILAVFLIGVMGISVASAAVVAGPKVSAFSPASGGVGSQVVIGGTGFTGATSVQFGGKEAVFTVDSATQITATVPPSALTGKVRVATAAGAAQSASLFTVTKQIAKTAVSSFSPASGGWGATVVIHGGGFTGATGVQFGGGVLADFTVNSDSQITATVPSHSLTGYVRVTSPSGVAQSSTVFTSTQVPLKVSSLSPTSGSVGSQVVVKGSGLAGATGVSFGGVAATSFTVDSDSQISVIVPSGAITGAVTVITPGGSFSSATFTLLPAPSWFHGINRTSGKAGDWVEITVDAALASDQYAISNLSPTINGTRVPAYQTARGVNGAPTTLLNVYFQVPASATSGYITFSAGGVTYTVPTWFTIKS
jgi:large repetitive protein